MSAHGLKGESVWPYRFEIVLEPYRRRGDLPPSTPSLYFDLWLFDDPDVDRQFLNRYSGPHPYQDADRRSNFYAEATHEEVRGWVKTQRAVLAELRWIAMDTERDLEAGAGMPAVRLCHELMVVVAEEHWTVLAAIMAAVRGPSTRRVRLHAPWTEAARRRRETQERNARYGGGYSSG